MLNKHELLKSVGVGNKRHVGLGNCQPVVGRECLEPRVEVVVQFGSLKNHRRRKSHADGRAAVMQAGGGRRVEKPEG